MRPLLLAGVLIALMFASPALATPRESPWSASILAGPVGEYPDGDVDKAFAIRAGMSRRITGPWDAAIEAGYTRFGIFHYAFAGDDGSPGVVPDSDFLDSFDVSFGARWHPNIEAAHPYVSVGAGPHAENGYWDSDISRQFKPGVYAGAGLHGVFVPTLGIEFRWLTIYDDSGPPNNRNKDLLSILLSLTRE